MRKRFESPLFFGVLLLLCATFTQGQYYVRWDIGQPGSAGAVTLSGNQLFAVPGVALNFCYSPANAVPCTNFAPTFNATAANALACSSSSPIVLQGSSVCVGTGDNFGNLGVWTLPGTYAYTLTVNGVSSGPYTVSIAGPMATVYAAPGETLAHAAARLPSSGGYVFFATGSFGSGNYVCSTPNVWLQGTGMPNLNSNTAPTALTGGTIITGTVSARQGCDHFLVSDLGVDVGPNWVNNVNSGVSVDGLVIFNAGQTVGAPQVQSPIFRNTIALGYSLSAPNHCMLMENVNHGLMQHDRCFFNQHGFVLKGTNSSITDGSESAGHSIDSVLIKSDDYAVSSDDTVDDFSIHSLATPGDTVGLSLNAVAAPLSNITVSNGTFESVASHAVFVSGTAALTPATGISLVNLTMNYPSAPGGTYGIQLQQYVQDTSIDNAYIANYPIGVSANNPVSFQNDNSVTNSKFVNNATVGVELYGRGAVTGNSFTSVGIAIQADNSVLNECNNSMASVSTRLATGSGTFTWCGQAVEDVSGNLTFPGNVGAGGGSTTVFRCATAGALPTGALTINAASCGTTADSGLRVK